MQLKLNGAWNLIIADDSKVYGATVPGCNYLDAMTAGLIPDPFVANNEKDCYWLAEKDCTYYRDFIVTEDLFACDKLVLTCKMLDTICALYINNNLVGKAENCHISHEFDVTKYLVVGANNITIKFKSPVNYVKEKQLIESAPANNNGQDGIVHIRKPQCHFGWDWGPILPVSGICDDIFIECVSCARFNEFDIVQQHKNGEVDLIFKADITQYASEDIVFCVSVKSPTGEVFASQCDIKNSATLSINIINPMLWWTRELSGQDAHLYEVEAELKVGEKVVAVQHKKIGLRTIKLCQEVDSYGKNFCFELNGVRIFAKGANWIPCDSFITRVNESDIYSYIRTAVDSNFNMLRVWGGGYYESDIFYDICDKLGILVWQDCGFACQAYPFFDEKFRLNVMRELKYNIQRLKSHASLCLWCGNNEIEAMAIAWATRRNYVKWTEQFFWNILPEFFAEADCEHDYIAGTPIGTEHAKGVNSDNVGDTHLWAVWHGLQPMTYYRKRMTRFCSEFGFESLPDINTIKTFATPKDYSLTSTVFSAHQKCASGNMKMAYYIASRFRLPAKFEDYIYLSSLCQAECIRDATEHWRRNKGICNGSLYWQYNDCWPVCSWAGLDYNKNYKALQYISKNFFAPIMVSLEDSRKQVALHIINDKMEAYDCTINADIVDYNGKTLWDKQYKCKVSAQENNIIATLNTAKYRKENCVLRVILSVNGAEISRKTMLFKKEKEAELPIANIKSDITIANGVASYALTTDKYARLVALHDSATNTAFSDNYFDLFPNETKIVTLTVGDKVNVADLTKRLSLTSVADIAPKGSALADFIFRAKVFFTPINFFSWIYYGKVPAKIKVKGNQK